MGWLLEQETATANGPYDLAVAWAQFPDLRDLVWDAVEKGRVHDVQTRQKLIDIGEGCYMRYYTKLPGEEKGTLLRYNLSDVHARYFGTRMEKSGPKAPSSTRSTTRGRRAGCTSTRLFSRRA
jgi:hypothetical protein